MQRDLNTGVYKAGFTRTQEDYDKNVPVVFAALNKLKKIIHSNGGPYILGKDLTELDIRAYATVVRFDTVYVQHFKCNLGTIRQDYPQINNWLNNLYWNVKGFRETTDFKHFKENYNKSHADINPLAITPMGPWPEVEEGYEIDVGKGHIRPLDNPTEEWRLITSMCPGLTIRSSNIKFNNWTVYNGDDSIALKGNSTNISITNSRFYNGLGIATGSIGQYKDAFETIERFHVENITYDNTVHALYSKTWTADQNGYPPNGGGGGLGCEFTPF
ncbi:hypothetical protein VTK56DRAFT_8315 [Thermocarpiscus australiensis]